MQSLDVLELWVQTKELFVLLGELQEAEIRQMLEVLVAEMRMQVDLLEEEGCVLVAAKDQGRVLQVRTRAAGMTTWSHLF